MVEHTCIVSLQASGVGAGRSQATLAPPWCDCDTSCAAPSGWGTSRGFALNRTKAYCHTDSSRNQHNSFLHFLKLGTPSVLPLASPSSQAGPETRSSVSKAMCSSGGIP